MVALCTVEDVDISRWMVQQGQAIAFRRCSIDYVADEDAARMAKVGIWAANSKILPNSATSLARKCRVQDVAPVPVRTMDRAGRRCGGRSAYLRSGGTQSACSAKP